MADSPENTAPKSSLADSLLTVLTLRQRDGTVRVDDCIDVLGENSILLALLLFTLLSTLPLFGIPGFTTITGIPIVLLGAQLMTGREEIWLPKRIRNRALTSPKLWHWMQRILPYVRKVERLIQPRLLPMSSAPMLHVAGTAFVLMGILLALPIPLINFPAGFSMFILAVGLVERDGILITLGLAIITLMLLGIGLAFMQAAAAVTL